jgi:hypothetical protein
MYSRCLILLGTYSEIIDDHAACEITQSHQILAIPAEWGTRVFPDGTSCSPSSSSSVVSAPVLLLLRLATIGPFKKPSVPVDHIVPPTLVQSAMGCQGSTIVMEEEVPTKCWRTAKRDLHSFGQCVTGKEVAKLPRLLQVRLTQRLLQPGTRQKTSPYWTKTVLCPTYGCDCLAIRSCLARM